MIARAGARYIQEVALGVVDILEVRIVGNRLHAALEQDRVVIARSNYGDREFLASRWIAMNNGS